MKNNADISANIKQFTEVRAPDLCPQMPLHLLPAGESFASFHERTAAILGAAPPYWAVAWPGGQAIAKYLFDNPELVKGRVVADLGSGCGIAAIAAVQTGARDVLAVDQNATARIAIRTSGILNSVEFAGIFASSDALQDSPPDLLIAGDLWYDAQTGRRATGLLRAFARRGVRVIVGDPGRSHFPRHGMKLLKQYAMQANEELEPTARIDGKVYELAG